MAVIEEKFAAPVLTGRRVAHGGIGARRLGLWLATAGWAALAAMWLSGSAELFGHDQDGTAAVPAVGLFLVGWTVMVAAMMLPSSLPTLARTDRAMEGGRRAAPTLMLGYLLPWATFGLAAFAGDGVLHLIVDRVAWLAESPSLIVGAAATFAGVTELVGRMPPPSFPTVPSGAAPFWIGRAHAIDRIRRCWPLMLFAMAVGMSSPAWMIVLTLVMVLELNPRAGAVMRLAGVVLIALGAAVVIGPSWTPLFFGAA